MSNLSKTMHGYNCEASLLTYHAEKYEYKILWVIGFLSKALDYSVWLYMLKLEKMHYRKLLSCLKYKLLSIMTHFFTLCESL